MSRLHHQNFEILIETSSGSLEQTQVALVSTSESALVRTEDKEQLLVGIQILFLTLGARLVSVALSESIPIDLLLP